MTATGTASSAEAATVEVGIADYAVTDNGAELATFGLGSCVAVAVYDADAGVSGLAHVMLPSAAADGGEAGKYADTAVRAVVREMEELGADRDRMGAKLVGGSEMFDFTGIAEGVGRRNVAAAREELSSLDIDVEAEDVGGDHGRSVRFDGRSGTLELKTAADGRTEL